MHFDMTVNLGNILTAVGLVVAFAVAHVQNVRKLQDIDTKLQMIFEWWKTVAWKRGGHSNPQD